jgi:glycosyltransferase involved in cell wall biosynthesis
VIFPGVSVIIAAYNGQSHVGAALASVCLQTQQPEAIVVVDAGSGDGTIDLLRAIAARYPAVRVIEAAGRLTAPQARNIALQQVTSPFVATLDQDDLMARHRLADQVAGLVNAPHLIALGGRLLNVDSAGVRRPPFEKDLQHLHGRPRSAEQVRWAIVRYSPALSSGLIYRTEGLRALGGFDEAHPLVDDYAQLARLSELGVVEIADTVVGGYRKHDHMTSVVAGRRQFHETRLLQWRLIHERLGIFPTVAAVAALVRPDQDSSAAALLEARSLWDALYSEARTRIERDEADRSWVEVDYQWLRQRLDRRIADVTAASTRL